MTKDARNEVFTRWCARRVLPKDAPDPIRQWVATGGDALRIRAHRRAQALLPKEDEDPDTDWATVSAMEAVAMASDFKQHPSGSWVSWVMRAAQTSRYRRVWEVWKAAYPSLDLEMVAEGAMDPWTVWPTWAKLAGKAEEAAQLAALSYLEQLPATLTLIALRDLLGSIPGDDTLSRAWLLREVWRAQGAQGDLLNVGIDYCNGHRHDL